MRLLILLSFFIVVLSQTQCHYNIQERDCAERIITSRNCTQGTIFWSYPRNNCSYAISQPISGQYSAEISVRELYSLNYTITITEQITVERKFF
jgi:hypothetical protein